MEIELDSRGKRLDRFPQYPKIKKKSKHFNVIPNGIRNEAYQLSRGMSYYVIASYLLDDQMRTDSLMDSRFSCTDYH